MRYLTILLTVLIISGCGKPKETTTAKTGITAITSNFAVYDFARTIGGNRATVSLLLKPGVESHSFEPTAQDMIAVKEADLFICVGLAVEPWVEKLIKGAEVPAEKIVETGRTVQFLTHEHDEHEEDGDHQDHANCAHAKPEPDAHANCNHAKKADHDDHANCTHGGEQLDSAGNLGPVTGGDPHIWVDPIRAMLMVEEIAVKFIEIDSAGATEYRHRADSLKQEINKLHSRLDSTIQAAPNRTIMYAGHFAFGYFADRYKLEHLSPYTAFSPNAEPTPAKIAEMIALVKEKKIRAVYYEELIEPRIAKTITDATGTEMILLHGIHNVSSTEMAGTFSYLSGMEQNRLALAKGLAQ